VIALQDAYGYRLVAVGQPLQRESLGPLRAGSGEVVIEIAGCGVCHTDVSFAYQGVPTRHALPLVLGHEISGRVIDCGKGTDEWVGRSVVVPAVIPCGDCAPCRAGRATICRHQFMPGNDGHGGFATHVVVPAQGLCQVPDELPAGLELAQLAVVADAVTTPLEAARRASLGPNDVAVFVGVGGIGGFGVQIARAMGAAVAAIDVDQTRLDLASTHGASLALNAGELHFKDLRAAIRAFVRESARDGIGLKIFETSGTPAGQNTAFGLLDHGAHLAVVGYTPEKLQLRLSNLMAFDATAAGNWGCPPEHYPAAVDMVLEGRIVLEPYVEHHPLDAAPEVLELAAHHELRRRAILRPQ
jgi:6-hydroxycyclohex-1-ene-1-carbonyl-CoA dehydrogenase